MKRSLRRGDALRVARGAREDRLVHGRHRRVPGRLRLVEPVEEVQRVEARRAEDRCRRRRATTATAAIRPWMWNSGMMLRQRSAGVSASVSRMCLAEAARLRLAQRHDLRAARWCRRCAAPARCRRPAAGPDRPPCRRSASPASAELPGRRVGIGLEPQHRHAELLGDRLPPAALPAASTTSALAPRSVR